MKVQVVIPCINLWSKYTRACVESVFKAREKAMAVGIEVRVLLVDNASVDETREEAGKLVSEFFSHTRNEEMWGFQRSVNYGVNDGFARGFDYVLVCNNDIILHEDALIRLERRMILAAVSSKMPRVGMVSCMDVRGESTPETFATLVSKDKEAVEESKHPNFSAFMVNRNCWEDVGEFDELFFPAYYEDNDYHYRMTLAGYEAICLPTAMFYHYGSRTQNEALSRPITDSSHQHKRYVGKWGGSPEHETYKHPFGNNDNLITWTKQKFV